MPLWCGTNTVRGIFQCWSTLFFDAPRYVKTPNYTVLAQWLAAREEVDTVELGVAHLPMLYGKPWLTKDVNEQLAKQWLNHLVAEAAVKRDFPRTETQCMTCSQPCKEV